MLRNNQRETAPHLGSLMQHVTDVRGPVTRTHCGVADSNVYGICIAARRKMDC